jgi:ATP-dependent Clp protease protease subunit
LAIYDTMQYLKCDVTTYCVGQAASMARFSDGGNPRETLCLAQRADHDPSAFGRGGRGRGGYQHPCQGNPETRDRLNAILASHTGRSVEDYRPRHGSRQLHVAGRGQNIRLIDEVVVPRKDDRKGKKA